MMIRLRQVALVADDLESTVELLCARFGLDICHRDPGVAEFGLANALLTIGDQFLEVVSPTQPGTTAGRLLDKRCGTRPSGRVTGYMVIHEVDDLDDREAAITAAGVRIVWRGDFPTIRGRHLHPSDVGGAIVSIDQPLPNGSWAWAGRDWLAHQDTSVVTGIAGVRIGASDPDAMQARWAALGLDRSVGFAPAGMRGDGIDVLELVAADRSMTGELLTLDTVSIHLV
jgi:catechol 2,3-dioxygenase-like lactoylglutathione lyase family enzyme